MRSVFRNGIVAAVVAVVVAASAVGVASAASPAPVPGGPAGSGVCAAQASAARSGGTVAALRTFADCEIARRMTTLGQLSAAVGASKSLTSADAAALSTDIASASSGLASLKAKIDSGTSIVALKLQIVEIVTRFRVYLLLGPQVRLTIAADDVLALKPRFDGISTSLAGRIAQAIANGKDVASAQASLAAMNAAVASAEALASPLPAQLLALTPAQYNAGMGGPVLQKARGALIEARDDLKAAAQDGRDVLADLE